MPYRPLFGQGNQHGIYELCHMPRVCGHSYLLPNHSRFLQLIFKKHSINMADIDIGDHGLRGTQTPQRAAADSSRNDAIINAWLRLLYLQHEYFGNTLSISVEDFIKTIATSKTDYRNSWLSDDQVALPVVLLTALEKKRSDILVVPPTPASILGSIGLGIYPSNYFAYSFPDIARAMKSENIRWIVVPCNDGMTRDSEQAVLDQTNQNGAESDKANDSATATGEKQKGERKATKTGGASRKNGTKTMNEPRIVGTTDQGIGAHWGLMIIDKHRDDARWLDGSLEIGEERGKSYIKAMHKAGGSAGKILSGYEKVMRRAPGQITTSTLKYIPQDRHNNYNGDAGSACGPWVFAILEYILENPGFLSTDRGLKGTFDKRSKDHHRRNMGFDSWLTRLTMQSIISEEADKELAADDLPFKMTVPILKILGSIRPTGLLDDINNFLGNTPPTQRRHRRGSGVGGDNDEGGNDDDHDQQTSPKSPSLGDVVKLLQIVQENPDSISSLPAHQQKFLAEQMSLYPEAKRSPKQPAASFNIVEALQNHVVNFVQLPTDQLNDFVALNLVGGSLRPMMPEWEQRAILTHILGDFDNLSEYDSTTWKTNDSRFVNFQMASHDQIISTLKRSVATVPQPNLRGFITSYPQSYIDRLVAQRTGGDKGYLSAEKTIADEEPLNGEDALSHTGWPEGPVFNGLDDGALHPDQILRRMKKVHEPSAPRWSTTDIVTDRNKGKSTESVLPINPRKRAHEGVQPGKSPKKAKIDYATVSTEELFKEVNDNIKKHESIDQTRTPNEYTYRAILLVTKGGTFKNENAARCNTIWIRDSNVFTEGVDFEVTKENKIKLLNNIFHGNIRTRMQSRYEVTPQEVLNVGNSSSSDDDDSSNQTTPPKSPSPEPSYNLRNLGNTRSTENEANISPRHNSKSSTRTDVEQNRKDGIQPGHTIHAREPSSSVDNQAIESNTPLEVNPSVAHTETPSSGGTKRKRSENDGTYGTQTDTTEPPAKKAKHSLPSFLTVDEWQVQFWVDELPENLRRELYDADFVEIKDFRRARIWLERIFTDTFQTMQAKETLSEEDLKILRKWRFESDYASRYPKTDAGLRKFLNEMLLKSTIREQVGKKGSREKTIEFPDFREDESKWPDYWKDSRA